MSKLDVLDDAAVVEKYGVLASQYADFAVLRGDAPMVCSASPASGRRRPRALLAAHGDLGLYILSEAACGGLSAASAEDPRRRPTTRGVAPQVVDASSAPSSPRRRARRRSPTPPRPPDRMPSAGTSGRRSPARSPGDHRARA